MKNIVIILTCFILIIFLLPAMFTKRITSSIENDSIDKNKEQKDENINNDLNLEETMKRESDEKNTNKMYSYKKYGTIKLLHTESNTIEEMSIDKYLLGVVSAEMPASFEEEALKAQAVVARTYTIYTIEHNNQKHDGADICDSSKCCQAWISKENRMKKWDAQKQNEYWSKIENAVNSTAGKIITYNKEVIDAFFHSNSGGKTEVPVNVWGGTNYPYLQTVETAGEDAYSQYLSEVSISKEEFEKKIKAKHENFQINYNDDDAIKILEYTESNRVKVLKVGNLKLSGVEVRTLLGLRSAQFEIDVKDDTIKFEVKGYGHGVGMSQTGANSMAKEGANYEEIIKHFYNNVQIEEI